MDNPIHILILEDSPSDAELVRFELEEAGINFTSKVVMTETDFIHELQESCPDIILSDYDLPKYTGASALAEARRRCPDTPFILVTGAVTEDRAIEILTGGAKDYVMKNRLQQRLVPAVRRALDEAEEYRARRRAEEDLWQAHLDLEAKVRERTAELEAEIAERRRTEKALRESEERYRALFSGMTEGFAIHEIITNEQGTPVDWLFLDINPAFERMTGLKREEVVGRTYDEVLPGDDPKWLHMYGEVALTGVPVQFENYSPALKRHYEVLAYSPAPRQFAVIFMDVTERKRAEETLKSSEMRFRSVLDNSLDCIYRFNLQTGHYEYISPSAEMVMGFSPDELMAQDIETALAMVHQDDLPSMRAGLASLEKTGKVYIEYRQLTKSGDYSWISNHISLIRDNSNRPLYRDGSIRDITEQKQAEDILREYQMAIEATDDLIAVVDRNYKYRMVNDAFLKKRGMLREHVIGKSVEQLLGREAFESVRPKMDMCFRGEPVNYEIQYPYPSVGTRDLDVKYYPLKNDVGIVERLVSVITDITERKQVEMQLNKLSKTLKALSDSSQAIIKADDEQAFLNDVCKIIIEDCGYSMVWIGFAENDEAKSVRPAAHAGFEEGYLETLQITWADTERGHGPTGTAIRNGKIAVCRNMMADPAFAPWREQAIIRGYASSIVFPLIVDGKVLGAITIYSKETDPFSEGEMRLLTELADNLTYGIDVLRRRSVQKQAEEALKEYSVKLEATNKELESFSYSVSHDLRAPLRAIDGYSRMILKKYGDTFSDDVREKFEVIRDNTRAMGQLIDDLLALSRAGRQEIEKTVLDIRQLIEKTWQELQTMHPDREMELKIDSVPPVWCDRALIKQVFVNLLSNAIKFTGSRKRALVEVGGYEKDNEVICYVKDNGAGFDMQYKDKLFGVFQRLHGASEYEGTGIGLAIVKRIIHHHGGRVWAEGKVDEGAVFYFTLPLKEG
jgi:PAS domain S-box-containing protein